MRSKTIIIALSILLIIMVVFVVLYSKSGNLVNSTKNDRFALIENSLVNNTSGTTGENKTEDKPQNDAGLTLISNSESKFLILGVDSSSVLYYSPLSGDIWTTSLNGLTSQKLVTKIGKDAINIDWASDRNAIIVSYPNYTAYYDIRNGTSKKYDNHIINPVFGIDPQNISYVYFNDDTGEGSISISDALAKNFKNILQTRTKNWTIKWLDRDSMAITNGKEGSSTSLSLSILKTDGSLRKVLDSKEKLETLWSPDKNKIAYSYVYPRTGELELRIFDISSGTEIKTTISTKASKCTWVANNKDLICATSESTRTNTYNDKIISIDTSLKDQPIKIILENSMMNISSIVFSSLKNTIIFTNSSNGYIYKLSL